MFESRPSEHLKRKTARDLPKLLSTTGNLVVSRRGRSVRRGVQHGHEGVGLHGDQAHERVRGVGYAEARGHRRLRGPLPLLPLFLQGEW